MWAPKHPFPSSSLAAFFTIVDRFHFCKCLHLSFRRSLVHRNSTKVATLQHYRSQYFNQSMAMISNSIYKKQIFAIAK